MMYYVKSTEYAHVNPADWLYKIVLSRHRRMANAIKALEQEIREMEARCGSGAWDCNMKIFEEE